MTEQRSIFRVEKSKDNPYVMINKVFLYDKKLSLKAKGLLTFLLSKPDDWQFYIVSLAGELKETRDTIANIIKELIEFGYVQKEKLPAEQGKFTGHSYKVYETPGKPCIENRHGETVTEKPALLSIDLTKELKTKEGGTPPVKTLEEDIKDRMRTTLGNKSFTVTVADRAFLTEKLKHHSEKMLYSLFFTWSEKPTAKQRTDLHFFTVDFNALLAAEKAKPAIPEPKEPILCPYCKRRMTDGECVNPFCEASPKYESEEMKAEYDKQHSCNLCGKPYELGFDDICLCTNPECLNYSLPDDASAFQKAKFKGRGLRNIDAKQLIAV